MERLPAADAKSRAIVEQMRDDEARHGEAARAAGASELPFPVKGPDARRGGRHALRRLPGLTRSRARPAGYDRPRRSPSRYRGERFFRSSRATRQAARRVLACAIASSSASPAAAHARPRSRDGAGVDALHRPRALRARFAPAHSSSRSAAPTARRMRKRRAAHRAARDAAAHRPRSAARAISRERSPSTPSTARRQRAARRAASRQSAGTRSRDEDRFGDAARRARCRAVARSLRGVARS